MPEDAAGILINLWITTYRNVTVLSFSVFKSEEGVIILFFNITVAVGWLALSPHSMKVLGTNLPGSGLGFSPGALVFSHILKPCRLGELVAHRCESEWEFLCVRHMVD